MHVLYTVLDIFLIIFVGRIWLRLLRTFAGVLPCPPGKHSYAHHFKGKHSKLSILGKVNKRRFGKFFNSAEENCNNDRKNDHGSFSQINEFKKFQNSAEFCDIWLEYSLADVKPRVSWIFEFYNISPVAIFNAVCIVYSLLLELDRLIKK